MKALIHLFFLNQSVQTIIIIFRKKSGIHLDKLIVSMKYCNSKKYIKLLLFFTIGISKSIYSNGQLYINEIFITNASADLYKGSYNYLDWIEIFNGGTTTLNLADYYLTDDTLNLKKWRFHSTTFKPNSFYTVFADGVGISIHTNFKLKADGGVIILSDASGTIIDKLIYKKQYYNISSGRQPDGSATWYYFQTYTKGKPNTSQVANKISGNVVCKPEGGFYSAQVNVVLTSSTGTGSIYYTLDGSEPSINSNLYAQPLLLKGKQILRARVIENGRLPGAIRTETYLINERRPELPVVSLVTEPRNLWNDTIGIYVAGKNGITAFCSDSPKNWNRDWERSANFEMFDVNQMQVINQSIGTKLMGACSRLNPQKSMVISAKSKYGKGKLEYKFFTRKSVKSFDGICLRNSGNDFPYTMLRDAMMQTLTIGRLNLEYQADQPVAFYLNGMYWGLINMRERSSEDLLTSNFGIDENNIDLLENNSSLVCGSASDYDAMLSFMGSNNMADPDAYKVVESQMDIDNFINYEIFDIYINNKDWPGNNIKYWRTKNPLSKWRWIIYDTDFGFGLYNHGPDENALQAALDPNGPNWPNPPWSTFLLRKLLENADFKTKFINRFYANINTTFKTNRVIQIIDSMQNKIANEMQYHLARWGSDLGSWNSNVEILRDFARRRPSYMRQFLHDQFSTGEDANVYYHSNIPGIGHMAINGVPSIDSSYTGIFPSGTVLDVKFIPNDGYKFVRAYRNKNTSKLIKLIGSGDSWKYYDNGTDLDVAWRSETYDDTGWASGNSELGYGDGKEANVVSYGSNDTDKYITTYFRKSFYYNINTPIKNASLKLMYDDGAVIYLNGTELLRVNMPSGKIGFDTLAYGYNGSVEDTFFSFPFDAGLLKNGKNVFAVEMHQFSKRSSDISFNLELEGYSSGTMVSSYVYNSEVTDTLDGDITYTAYYEPADPITNLVINELNPYNYNFPDEFGHYSDWIEILNTGSDITDMAGLFFSDSLNKSIKWKVPFGYSDFTIIKPGEYKIFWADNNTIEGPLHMNFKLSRDGEALALLQIVASDTNVIDEIEYGTLYGKRTFSRIPNGSGNFKWVNHATPEKENMEFTNLFSDKNNFNKPPVIISYDNRMKTIYIQSTDNFNEKNGNIIIYEISGRVVYNNRCDLKTGVQIRFDNNPSGVYLFQFISNNYTYTKKILLN
jgi:hypothetical protein